MELTAQQAAALAHQLRHRIWREIDPGGSTVSQLTHRLATNKGNVAHHVKVLVDAGLVRKDRTRTVRGGTEQYYVRTADRIWIEADDDAARAMFSVVADEIVRARDPLLNHRTLRLTRAQAEALARHLDRVVNELEPAAERERRYGVLVSVYPRG